MNCKLQEEVSSEKLDRGQDGAHFSTECSSCSPNAGQRAGRKVGGSGRTWMRNPSNSLRVRGLQRVPPMISSTETPLAWLGAGEGELMLVLTRGARRAVLLVVT